MKQRLRVPCAYQGGKQRIASQIVSTMLSAASGENTMFYDLCCGSGAISIELVNRGVKPDHIIMLDRSSWGTFWSVIGSGQFDLGFFEGLLAAIPDDKRKVKQFMQKLASLPIQSNEAELYPVLQACSFGGKQIWKNGNRWNNAFFRDYWEPTPNSIRRSAANPMQPSPSELNRRVVSLIKEMKGVTCFTSDIMSILEYSIPSDAVVYVDPPYSGKTDYAFSFDIEQFIMKFQGRNAAPLFVSEGYALSENAEKLAFGGAKGGISGLKSGKHEEWLSFF